MRISDWSSDVCSSDLPVVSLPGEPHIVRGDITAPLDGRAGRRRSLLSFVHLTDQHIVDGQSPSRVEFLDRYANGDRKSVVSGKSVSVRVDLGGSRIITKKNEIYQQQTTSYHK